MTSVEGLSNDFIQKVARKIEPKFYPYGPYVVSCEELADFGPEHVDEMTYIINSALKSEKRGHFALLQVIPKSKKIRVYCSLKIILKDPNVAEFVDQIMKVHPNFSLESSPWPVQSPLSSMCGVWVLGFLASTTKAGGKLSMKRFYSKFSTTDLEHNDQICLRYLLDFIVNKLGDE